ncbi:hypothetical protein CYMTET_10085 [Cymbomonas tetramitiformis]|uniref:Uncharacterized protein n=1 Tax=Cymbomonas tetramitiformis TaxID=36881 RepID=A0AAE0LED3_9CHLO|nr:hypothetical protein CYMTET_10085 [Cymbomonas tetramitiformis]
MSDEPEEGIAVIADFPTPEEWEEAESKISSAEQRINLLQKSLSDLRTTAVPVEIQPPVERARTPRRVSKASVVEHKPADKPAFKKPIVRNICEIAIITSAIDSLNNCFLNTNMNGISDDAHDELTLERAARAGNVPELQKLLNAGADPNERHHRQTALHSAARYGQVKCIELLVKAGADVDARKKGNQTALITAVLQNRQDCVKKLLDLGADFSLRDSTGRTAFQHSKAQNNTFMSDLLRYFEEKSLNTEDEGSCVAIGS